MPTKIPAEVSRVATIVADRCHKPRKYGQAPQRYAIIYQAACLGILEYIKEQEA